MSTEQAAVTAGFHKIRIDLKTLGILSQHDRRHPYEQLGFKATTTVENSITVKGKPWDHIEMRLPRH